MNPHEFHDPAETGPAGDRSEILLVNSGSVQVLITQDQVEITPAAELEPSVETPISVAAPITTINHGSPPAPLMLHKHMADLQLPDGINEHPLDIAA